MSAFILFVVLIGSDGTEQLKKVNEHKTLLSCKAEQANYQDLQNRIKYFCADKSLYKQIYK